MHSRTQIWGTVAGVLAALAIEAPPASAIDAQIPFLRARVEVLLDTRMAPLMLAPAVAVQRSRRALDFATFASELTAYIAKEVLDDAPDEFSDSEIKGPLSRSMPDSNSRFGTHCLIIVSEIGETVGEKVVAPTLASTGHGQHWAARGAGWAARGAGTAFAIHEVWRGFRRDVSGDTDGFSINPKVGANKLAVAVTLRW